MSSLFHSENQRVLGLKLEGVSSPTVWPFKQTKVNQREAVQQIFTEDDPLPASKRLIVVLPDANMDLLTLPRRIWNFAAPDCRQVLLMIRPCQVANEFHNQMDLTTLAAMIRDSRVTVQTQLILGQSFKEAARTYARPDDLFVCFAEHQEPGFLKKRPLAEVLNQATHLPVYTLKGAVSENVEPISARMIDILFLALCLVSLIAFFAVQVWIDRNFAGTLKGLFQMLAVFVEVWLIGGLMNRSLRL